jgi:hypothetical protein
MAIGLLLLSMKRTSRRLTGRSQSVRRPNGGRITPDTKVVGP